MSIHFKDIRFPWPVLVLRHLLANGKRSALKCPPKAAYTNVTLFQGHLFFLDHFNILKCPFSVAFEHVSSSQGHLVFLTS
jgi:hypothetical protein